MWKLNPKSAELLIQISDSCILKTEQQIQAINDAIAKVHVMATSEEVIQAHQDTAAIAFPQVDDLLQTYERFLKASKTELQERICEILPRIRSGMGNELEIETVSVPTILRRNQKKKFGDLGPVPADHSRSTIH